MFENYKIKVLSKGKWIAYIISAASFIITLYLLPSIVNFISPYLSSQSWAGIPGSYLVAWIIALFIIPNIIYVVFGSMIK
jgi:hypothetical protein